MIVGAHSYHLCHVQGPSHTQGKGICYTEVWRSGGGDHGVGCGTLESVHSFPYEFYFKYPKMVLLMSDSLQSHGLQHTRLPYASPTPGACSDSCPSSWWCHLTISPSAISCHPLSHLQSFPASGSFPMSHSSHQVAKVLEFQLQHQSFQWIFRLISFRMDWFDLLAVQGTLKSLIQHHSSKASVLWLSAFFMIPTLTSIHDYWKNHSFDYTDFVGKVTSLLFNTLSRF